MALARTRSVGLLGLVGQVIEVEADVAAGLPGMVITGLPDPAVAQSRDRIRAAIVNSALEWPNRRITVGLSPAWFPKQGTGHDLAMATAILAAGDVVAPEAVAGTVFLGELGLDGRVRAVRGALPATLAAVEAQVTRLVVPAGNLAEVRLVQALEGVAIELHAVSDLASLISLLRGEMTSGQQVFPPLAEVDQSTVDPVPDLSDVAGQELGRRAVEVAAAGRHNLALFGPPGAGKTMLAERLPGVLPPLTAREALEVYAIKSIAGAIPIAGALSRRPPYNAPHHTATTPALVGGGSSVVRPGAVSLAHHGVLFLDEATEFPTRTLDALRQPIERGEVVLARAQGVVRYPAQFQLVVAANLCPCAARRPVECSCAPGVRRRYVRRISAPLLDRVDIQVELPPITPAALHADTSESDCSELIAKRVADARCAAAARWSRAEWGSNARIPGPALRGKWRLPPRVTAVADHALERGQLTARGYDRILRLSWTLCDLRGAATPNPADVAEATAFRLRRLA